MSDIVKSWYFYWCFFC